MGDRLGTPRAVNIFFTRVFSQNFNSPFFLLFSWFLYVDYLVYYLMTASLSLWTRLTGQSVKMLKPVMSPNSFRFIARDQWCHANVENNDKKPDHLKKYILIVWIRRCLEELWTFSVERNVYKVLLFRVVVYGHTTLKTPVLVRSPKLSNVGRG